MEHQFMMHLREHDVTPARLETPCTIKNFTKSHFHLFRTRAGDVNYYRSHRKRGSFCCWSFGIRNFDCKYF